MSERRSRFGAAAQVRLLTPLAVAWMIGAGLLTATGVQRSVPLEQLFLDPANLTGAPWYTGVISNLGILCWTAGVVTSAGGAWVSAHTGRASAARFLAAGAVVGGLFLLDDLLQLHSDLLPGVLGVGKPAAVALVTAPSLGWAVLWWREIRRTRWLILVAFLAGSVVSLAVDHLLDPDGAAGLLAEDGAKFLAVVAWAIYFTTTAVDITRSTIDAAVNGSASTGSASATPGDEGVKLSR